MSFRMIEIDGGSAQRMHGSIRYNSSYSDYVDAVFAAHGRVLLQLALSGSLMRGKVRVLPLSKSDAEDCVQTIFAYFLKGIENRKPDVMAAILDNPPESKNMLHMLIPILQYRAIDINRTKMRYRADSDLKLQPNHCHSASSTEDRGRFVDWLVEQKQTPWHQPPINPEDTLIYKECAPLNRLNEILSQAISDSILTDQEQEAFRLLIQETIGEVTDQDAALKLNVSVKRYQNLRSIAKRKLQAYVSSRKGR